MGMKGGEGAYGHDLSNNDADGWKRSSAIWVEGTFRSGLRDYKGVDMGFTEEGETKSTGKDQKQAQGTNLGSIYRSSKQSSVLSTARADEHFLGSLRSEPLRSQDDYQRTRRSHLNLPQYKDLTPEQEKKVRRIFASIGVCLPCVMRGLAGPTALPTASPTASTTI